ncbi:MAG: hypothetical protein AAF806_25530, partial [Bacteroidota bacterium]
MKLLIMMKHLLAFCLLFAFVCTSNAQDKKEEDQSDKINFSAFKLRNVGPAFTAGRIADIAIHPEDDNVWYVAV